MNSKLPHLFNFLCLHWWHIAVCPSVCLAPLRMLQSPASRVHRRCLPHIYHRPGGETTPILGFEDLCTFGSRSNERISSIIQRMRSARSSVVQTEMGVSLLATHPPVARVRRWVDIVSSSGSEWYIVDISQWRQASVTTTSCTTTDTVNSTIVLWMWLLPSHFTGMWLSNH